MAHRATRATMHRVIDMSLKLSSAFVANMINLITIIGVSLIAGSTIFLVIASSLDHNFLFVNIGYFVPLFMVGIVIIWIASKLSEILER